MAQVRIREVADIVRALQLARGSEPSQPWGGVVFLIGAGCSFSAEIPLAEQIARDCTSDLARRYSNGTFAPESSDAALEWLKSQGHLDKGLDWPAIYGELFERHFTDATAQRGIVRKAMERGRGINWAHLCLGELVRCRYCHTVLTTNFDQLVLEGVARAGILPVVADGVESLNRIDGNPAHPQVVHLHGSRHTYNPRNASRAVAETAEMGTVVRTLGELLRSSPALVVVGYAGGEEGVMRVLIQAARDLRDKTIFWTLYGKDPKQLSEQAATLLSFSHSGGVVLDQDADAFFGELMRDLNIGVPAWMKDPVAFLQDMAQRIVAPGHRAITAEIDRHHEELRTLAQALVRREKRRSDVQRRLDEFRELSLSGKPAEAMEVLGPVASRIRKPEDWEALGDVAYEVGKDRAEPDLLDRAVEAFTKALAQITRKRSPEDWGRCQVKLGNALVVLGDREKDAGKLERAVAGYREALEVYQHLPLDWARTQNNLGNALLKLGEQEGGTERLEQAVEAYGAALEVRTRDSVPLDWATTQSNLGEALRLLGLLEEGTTEKLERAVEAYRRALEVRTRERVPLSWAMTQNNLGNALQALGDRQADTRTLGQAVEAFRAALEFYTRERVPLDWAMTQNNLGNALQLLALHGEGTERLEEAIEAYRAALEVRTRDRSPLDWAMTQSNLGSALRLLGERIKDAGVLEQAREALLALLEVDLRERDPRVWSDAQENLGDTSLALWKLNGSDEDFKHAVESYGSALRGFEEYGSSYGAARVSKKLEQLKAGAA